MSLQHMKWHEQELILEKVFSFLSPCDLYYTRDSDEGKDQHDGCRLVNHLFNKTSTHSEFCKYYFENVFCLSRDSDIWNNSLTNNSSLDGIDFDCIQFQGVKRGMTEEDPLENNELIQLPESLGFIAMIGNCDGLKWKNGFHRKLLTCIANLQDYEKKNTKAIMPRLKQLYDWLDEGKQLKLQQFLTKLKLTRFMRMSFGLSRSVILTFRDDGLPVFIRSCYEPTVRFNNYEIIKSGKINPDCQDHNLFQLQKEDEETFLDLFCRGIFRKNFSSYQKTIAAPKIGFLLYIEEKLKTMEFANVQEKQKFMSEKRMEWYSNSKSSEVQEFTRRERQSSSAAFSESNEEVQEEFYPISCKRCKTNHKKCDKKLPACSYCSTRGITCCYEPRKVRKSSSSDDSNKRKKRKISSEWKAIIPSDDTILIEFYFDVLANGLPILSREKFNYFIMNGLEECLHSSSSLLNHGGDEIEFELLQFNSMMIESQVELKGLFVWYLSLLTLYYQFNAKSELAESTVELCEKHVQKFSFQCFNNMYYVAGCFALGLYLRASSDHQQEKTRFYRHYADLYFLKKKEVEIVDAFERNFHQSYLFLNYVMENEYIGDFTSLIQALPNFCKILPGKSIQDFVMPEIWNYLENSQLDSSNYMIFKHLLDGIVAFANQLKMSIVIDTTIQNQSSISKNYMELDNLVRNIIGEGFKLMFFMKIPQISEEIIELTALNITLQTENEIFKYVYPFTDVGIRKACEYHLMVCKQIEENKRTRKSSIQTPSGRNISFDNFELLEKDLKALESLGNRFKNVYKTNKQLMEECRKISKRQNNITDMSVSGISNTNIDYLQSCTQWNQENQENLLSSIIEFINSISNDNNEQATTLDESILDLHCNEE